MATSCTRREQSQYHSIFQRLTSPRERGILGELWIADKQIGLVLYTSYLLRGGFDPEALHLEVEAAPCEAEESSSFGDVAGTSFERPLYQLSFQALDGTCQCHTLRA